MCYSRKLIMNVESTTSEFDHGPRLLPNLALIRTEGCKESVQLAGYIALYLF